MTAAAAGAALGLQFALPTAGETHHASAVAATAPASCAGKADGSFDPPQVITGEFDTSLEGGYVLLPFSVPPGTTAVRVKYCHDQPEAPTNARIKHVLDLGLYDARGPDGFFDEDEFRGWGGSSHPDVTVSPNGFSDEATYVAKPREHVHGRTTRGFEPGAIPAGEWAVELGVAAVASQAEGDGDGKVAWRVEIALSDSSSWADQPYQPAPYDETPASSQPGWYAGDFHVHAEHSSLGDATMRETFDYAFAPLPEDCGAGCTAPGAGLDFITLSDYVSDSGWGEIGRFQGDYPGRQIVRSSEIITYRGHANNHASVQYVDYRTGPVYERQDGGGLSLERAARPASALFEPIHAAGGFTQINHPTIFPSQVPGFDFICRGCPWDYSDAETDYSKVDAVEISTGPPGLQQDPNPGPNPFTPLAVKFWEDAIDADGLNSNKIAAVGSSDSHNAGRTPDPITQAPIGVATTVVYAEELSEAGIKRAVEDGHSYVKVFGNDGPDLRFEAVVPASGGPPAIMGDTVNADAVDFTARVLGAGPGATRPGDYELFVFKDGVPILSAPVIGDDFSFPFPSLGPGRYRLQLQRDTAIEAVSSPIYLESPAADLSVTKTDDPDPVRVGSELSYTVTVRNDGPSAASAVTLLDELPAGVGFGSAQPSQGNCSETGGQVSCALGALAAGESASVLLSVTPEAAGTITNRASVSADESDPDGADNAVDETTLVRPDPGYPVPREASRLTVSLIPAFRQTIGQTQCAARGGSSSTHGSPLSFQSCNPPAFLPGTVARLGAGALGSASLSVLEGDLGTPADEADVAFAASVSDVRDGLGADYDPAPATDATLVQKLRISDMYNGAGLDEPATVTDFDFDVPLSCAPTPGAEGATCSAATSGDTLVPGAIKEGRDTIVQVFRVRLNDAGVNGAPGDGDDRMFAVQGLYAP